MVATGFTKVNDISILWKKAMEKKDDTYDEVVIPVVEKIVSISYVTYISFTFIYINQEDIKFYNIIVS